MEGYIGVWKNELDENVKHLKTTSKHIQVILCL